MLLTKPWTCILINNLHNISFYIYYYYQGSKKRNQCIIETTSFKLIHSEGADSNKGSPYGHSQVWQLDGQLPLEGTIG